jgi:hypothetical protein
VSAAAKGGDAARVTVMVAVPPEVAFQVFTRDIDLWWKRGPRYRPGKKTGTLHFEERVGGRLFESYGDGQAETLVEVTVEHRGWSALREDHPARHGQVGSAFTRTLGMFWGELMSAMREHVSTSRGST